jgi:hypothetical protein
MPTEIDAITKKKEKEREETKYHGLVMKRFPGRSLRRCGRITNVFRLLYTYACNNVEYVPKFKRIKYITVSSPGNRSLLRTRVLFRKLTALLILFHEIMAERRSFIRIFMYIVGIEHE